MKLHNPKRNLGQLIGAFFLATIFFCSTGFLSAQVLYDDFSGSSVNATIWRTTLPTGGNTYTGGSSLTVSGGNLTASVGANTGTNHRAFLLSNASNFNFYLNPITIDIALGTLGGANTSASSFADHYVMISNLAGPERGYVNPSSPVSVYASAATTNGTTQLQLGSIVDGNLRSANATYTGTLTNMSLTLNATGFSLTGTGTGGGLPATVSGLWSSLGGISSTNFAGTYYLSLGASNRGTQTTGSSAQYSSINVIPEPSTYALLTIVGTVALIFMPRRRSLG